MNAISHQDPLITLAIAKFSPQVKKMALDIVDDFIKAINAGDEQRATNAENDIFNSKGPYGECLDAIMAVLN